MTGPVRTGFAAAARCLALDAHAVTVVRALEDAGVAALLLKGPGLARRLYADDPSRRRYSDVDVLVANAALPGSGLLETYTPEQIDRALDVNLRAPILMAHALAPAMVERGRGQLVFISSLAGKAANGGGSMYSATKFGVRGFALALRHDLADHGVGVTAINPGFIRDAGMFHESGAKLPPGVGTKTPEDVARAVVRAIEDDPTEIDVAPVALRAGAALAALAPGVADVVARRLERRARVAEQLGEAQASKR